MKVNISSDSHEFISDKRRCSYLGVVYNSIYRGKSLLIEGDYGVGKSEFLKLIRPKKIKKIHLESLDKTHELLASILEQLNYDVKAGYHLCSRHLKMITELSDVVIIVDEASDLDERIWPYFKRMIDAQLPIIVTGLPKVRTYLSHEHPDILSRLKRLTLYPVLVEDFIQEYSDFEAQAIELIYATTANDMRQFKEVCTDCRDKAEELKLDKIGVDLALSFLADFQHDVSSD